jgi:hypothetical protein
MTTHDDSYSSVKVSDPLLMLTAIVATWRRTVNCPIREPLISEVSQLANGFSPVWVLYNRGLENRRTPPSEGLVGQRTTFAYREVDCTHIRVGNC